MEQNKSIASRTVVVILAAGKGSRMGKTDIAKVCFEIDNQPAILRTVETFKSKGFRRFMVVTGAYCQQVMETLSGSHADVMYVYQSDQLGTGHAGRVAADALEKMDYDENVLVTMGDKYIAGDAIEELLSGHIKQNSDLSVATIAKTRQTRASGGRVFKDADGQIIDIIETADLARQGVVDGIKKKLKSSSSMSCSQLRSIIEKNFPNQKKRETALGEILKMCNSGKVNVTRLKKLVNSDKFNIILNGRQYSKSRIERHCKGVNPSLYLFKSGAFFTGIKKIDNNNAQKEYYLTDIVKKLSEITDGDARKYKVRSVSISEPQWIQGFNSPDELLAIQDYLHRSAAKGTAGTGGVKSKLRGSQYCSAREWLKKIDSNSASLKKWLRRVYGDHPELHKKKCCDIKKVLGVYVKKFGDEGPVCIVRAPGRINLMGRHVDHRGGYNNFLAIHPETIAVAGMREDDNVIAVNAEPRKFKKVEFNISQLIGNFAWSDWINFVNSDWVRDMLISSRGNWGNYIKASLLRLQHQYQDVKVRGLNMAITGDVPIAAGLSSSSTIVVASLQAAIALNNFELTSRQFIDLCGQGEWFVGSRGGAGDHAAIYLGQRGKIAQVGYHPFRVEKIIEAPFDYQIIIADSHIKAAKSESARSMFNSRIAAYNIGLALFKQLCPEVSQTVEHVRDIDPAKLGISISSVYEMLLKVPEQADEKYLRNILSSESISVLEENLSHHDGSQKYNLRGVLLFGASEVLRSRLCPDLLQAGEIQRFGELMKISHDGDRVSVCDDSGKYVKMADRCSDQYLGNLISDLRSESPERVLRAQLYNQPGCYSCSTVEIDKMVDIACSVQGVAGAQIAGAGLGGCIMILSRKESVDEVKRALVKRYYRPAKLEPAVLNCITVEGAGLAEF